jgi:site-specific recombinase XerC
MDKAIFTLATEAGSRLSEIRGLKVGNVDFEVGVICLEDGLRPRAVRRQQGTPRSFGPADS